MKLLQILALLAITAVEMEFGLHVEYLRDIRDAARQRIKKER